MTPYLKLFGLLSTIGSKRLFFYILCDPPTWQKRSFPSKPVYVSLTDSVKSLMIKQQRLTSQGARTLSFRVAFI